MSRRFTLIKVRVVDFETSGFEPPVAEVCEVGYCDVIIEDKHVCDPVSYLCGISGPMPPEVRAVHHIGKEDVESLDLFDSDRLDDGTVTVFAAHNWEFENRFFQPAKPAICTYKAALRVWPYAPSHSNGALFYWLLDQYLIDPDLSKSQPFHRAGPDAYATAWILVALLNSGATGKDMIAWTKEPRLLPKCTIGKFRGKPWSEVEEGFLGWMMKQVDMDADLRWNAARELKRRNQ